MQSIRRGLRLLGRALFVVLVVLAAAFAPVVVLPFVHIVQTWRDKEVAVLIKRDRRR